MAENSKYFGPMQRTQQEVGKDIEKDKFKDVRVGDIVQTEDGARLITQHDIQNKRFKTEPVKYVNGKWEEDRSRKARVIDKEDIKYTVAKNVNTPEMNQLIDKSRQNNPSQTNPEADKNKDEKDKERAVSFSVVTTGDVDGFVTGGNSYETIVTGTTKNGVTVKSNIMGAAASRAALASAASSIARGRDYTNENLDERKAYDDISDVVNQPKDIESVPVEGGPSVSRDEVGHEVSKPNGFEFDSDNPVDGFDPLDKSVSLEDIINNPGSLNKNGEIHAANEAFSVDDDFDGFERGEEPWNMDYFD